MITLGYVQTAVTVFESEGEVKLTVNITIPNKAVQIETSLFLLVNGHFRLGPFNNDVRQRSFKMTIMDDNVPEDDAVIRPTLTLDPADRARLEDRVTVSPDVAAVTIQDDDGK